jgi:5'(3')-deoxyribonucleotidase
MKIYLDMDGVLYAWNKGIAKMFNINYDNRAIQEEFAGDYEGLESHIGFDVVDKGIRDAGKDFWLGLEMLPWARDVFDTANKIAGDKNVYFLTSFGKWPEAGPAKVEVLARDFGVKSDKIVLTKSKFLLAREGTVLVDDKPNNIEEFKKHSGNTHLWPHEFSFLCGKVEIVEELDKLAAKFSRVRSNWG